MHEWAHEVIAQHITAAADALTAFCRKPRSAKCLHAARKALARLRAALDDLGPAAGVDESFYERIETLHKRAGKVRDADVLAERLDAYREDARGAERRELEVLGKALRRRRKRARRKLERVILQYPELHS
jgi:CHAD domain-containing protein